MLVTKDEYFYLNDLVCESYPDPKGNLCATICSDCMDKSDMPQLINKGLMAAAVIDREHANLARCNCESCINRANYVVRFVDLSYIQEFKIKNDIP